MSAPTVAVPAVTLVNLIECLSKAVGALSMVSAQLDGMLPEPHLGQPTKPVSASAPVVDLAAYRRTRGGAA